MPSIGSSPGIASGLQLDSSKLRAIKVVPPLAAQSVSPESAVLSATLAPAVAVSAAARDIGPAPVDSERVTVIKKAIESNAYPLVPAKIGDAMIAAGILLRTK